MYFGFGADFPPKFGTWSVECWLCSALHVCVSLTGLVVAFWIFQGPGGAAIAVWGTLSRHAPCLPFPGWRGCGVACLSQARHICSNGDGPSLWHGCPDVGVFRHAVLHVGLTPVHSLAQSKGDWWEYLWSHMLQRCHKCILRAALLAQCSAEC